MGVVPLVIARGAGAEMRHTMGVTVFSGMLGVTFFGLLLTPVFSVVVRGLVHRRSGARAASSDSGTPAAPPAGALVAQTEGGAHA
jgi:multidrug efflux pump